MVPSLQYPLAFVKVTGLSSRWEKIEKDEIAGKTKQKFTLKRRYSNRTFRYGYLVTT